jgi:hypothetical protein
MKKLTRASLSAIVVSPGGSRSASSFPNVQLP